MGTLVCPKIRFGPRECLFSLPIEALARPEGGASRLAGYGFCDTTCNEGFYDQRPPDCCNGIGSELLLSRHLEVWPAILGLSNLGRCERLSHDSLRGAVNAGPLCASSGA